MKIIFNILLSTLCLAFSTTSSANIDRLVESCAMSQGFFPNSGGGRIINSEGYSTQYYQSAYGKTFDHLKRCVLNDISFGEYNSEAERNEILNSIEFDEVSNTIIDPKNKIKFNFTFPKPPTREEICAELKNDPRAYEFCMGTRTFQHRDNTCKNSYGDPCGSTYDRDGAGGYTLRK